MMTPFRIRFGLVPLLATLLLAAPAHAIPPPMSPDRLAEASDIVARVRVLAVACTGASRDPSSGDVVPRYTAWIEIREVRKGAVKPHDTVQVTWQEIPKGVVGPWAVRYYPGEEMWTHLKWDDGARAYATTWWNARGEDIRRAERTDLPTVPGEVVTAPSLARP